MAETATKKPGRPGRKKKRGGARAGAGRPREILRSSYDKTCPRAVYCTAKEMEYLKICLWHYRAGDTGASIEQMMAEQDAGQGGDIIERLKAVAMERAQKRRAEADELLEGVKERTAEPPADQKGTSSLARKMRQQFDRRAAAANAEAGADAEPSEGGGGDED